MTIRNAEQWLDESLSSQYNHSLAWPDPLPRRALSLAVLTPCAEEGLIQFNQTYTGPQIMNTSMTGNMELCVSI